MTSWSVSFEGARLYWVSRGCIIGEPFKTNVGMDMARWESSSSVSILLSGPMRACILSLDMADWYKKGALDCPES